MTRTLISGIGELFTGVLTAPMSDASAFLIEDGRIAAFDPSADTERDFEIDARIEDVGALMMRLAPVSNLCSCWKVTPRRLARSAWLSPNSSRRSRMRLPTWPTISTSRGWRRLVLADFDDGHWLAIIDARLGLLEQIEQTKADALDRRRVDARHDVQRAKLGPGDILPVAPGRSAGGPSGLTGVIFGVARP